MCATAINQPPSRFPYVPHYRGGREVARRIVCLTRVSVIDTWRHGRDRSALTCRFRVFFVLRGEFRARTRVGSAESSDARTSRCIISSGRHQFPRLEHFRVRRVVSSSGASAALDLSRSERGFYVREPRMCVYTHTFACFIQSTITDVLLNIWSIGKGAPRTTTQPGVIAACLQHQQHGE